VSRKPYAAIATDHLQASRREAGYWSCADNTDPTIYRGRLDDPNVPVYIEGAPGQTTDGVRVARGKLYVTGDLSGPVRVYDMATKALVGKFETGSGGLLIDLAVTNTGDIWVTDGIRPVLWHLTPQQVAAGSGTATGLPVDPGRNAADTADAIAGPATAPSTPTSNASTGFSRPTAAIPTATRWPSRPTR
jgi:hypothetical protein